MSLNKTTPKSSEEEEEAEDLTNYIENLYKDQNFRGNFPIPEPRIILLLVRQKLIEIEGQRIFQYGDKMRLLMSSYKETKELLLSGDDEIGISTPRPFELLYVNRTTTSGLNFLMERVQECFKHSNAQVSPSCRLPYLIEHRRFYRRRVKGVKEIKKYFKESMRRLKRDERRIIKLCKKQSAQFESWLRAQELDFLMEQRSRREKNVGILQSRSGESVNININPIMEM